MRMSDWSSDVCSSDLPFLRISALAHELGTKHQSLDAVMAAVDFLGIAGQAARFDQRAALQRLASALDDQILDQRDLIAVRQQIAHRHAHFDGIGGLGSGSSRSEEHTSELQSLMRISYAVCCLQKKTTHKT